MRIESREELKEILAKNPDLAAANRQNEPQVGFLIGNKHGAYYTLKTQGTKGAESASKYHSRQTEYNGKLYASAKEASKAAELDLMKQAGEIDFYLRQVPFNLPGDIIYRADFVTFYRLIVEDTWKIKVIEVKGYETKEWKMKYKLFRATYPNLTIEVY